jgi:hypothetical protein
MQQDRLRVAVRHVAAGRHIVAKQRALIARLEDNGYETVESKQTLDLFEQTLAIFEEHHQQLLSEIARKWHNFAHRVRTRPRRNVADVDALRRELREPSCDEV